MARPANIENGSVKSFWLGEKHIQALSVFRNRHRYSSNGAALRAILEIVLQDEEETRGKRKKSRGSLCV